MRETAEDLAWLQQLLDHSYAAGGSHLTDIHTPGARLDAAAVVDRLDGMNVFVVATVSSDGRVFTGPVDGFLFHGRIHFGTSREALRARHLAARPTVSATHVRGEELVVTSTVGRGHWSCVGRTRTSPRSRVSTTAPVGTSGRARPPPGRSSRTVCSRRTCRCTPPPGDHDTSVG